MNSSNKFLYALIVVFIISCGLVYAIVTLVPVIACLITLFMAACTAENQFLVAGVVLLISFFLTVIASPFIRPLFEKKPEDYSQESSKDYFDK